MEDHWDTWVTEEDWGAIQAQGFNTVRIPVSGMEHKCPFSTDDE